MPVCGRFQNATIARLLTGAAAAVVTSALLATGASAQSNGDECTKVLANQYGAAAVDDSSSHQRNGRKKVYADLQLANGETARVRCNFKNGEVSGVDVYQQNGFGSATPGSRWKSAQGLATGPGPLAKDKKPDEKQAAAPTEPAKSEEAPPEPEFGVRKKPPQS